MNKEVKFLSTKGLTSSEANHITNIVKEKVKALEVTDVKISTTEIVKDSYRYKFDTNKRNENLLDDVMKVGELYSLSAWLKTAIKYKESLLEEIDDYEFVDVPKLDLPKQPKREDTSFEAYLAQLNIADRAEYLTAEAKATHIGKFVHNFDKYREEFRNFTPTNIQSINSETLILENRLLYSEEEFLEIFFKLQKEHREAEKIVNLYKARHHDFIKEKDSEYNMKYKEYSSEYNKITAENNNASRNAYNEFELYKKEERAKIANLRIVIPKNLQTLVDEIKGA